VRVRAGVRSADVRQKKEAPAASGLPYGLPHPPSEHEQLPAGISLCMIVKNEETFLAQALESVKDVVDEICVVDTGSTDGTVAIAEAYGARVVHRSWKNDFAWARNEAVAMATKRWVLMLDADEELSPESRAIVREIGALPAYLTGFWVRCFNLADDYAGTGASSHALARLFPNHPRLRYRSPIHEFITLDDTPNGIEAKQAPLSIIHHGYLKSVVVSRKKAARNLAIIEAATLAHPEDPFNWYNLGTTALLDNAHAKGIEALEKMRDIVGDQARGFVPVGLSILADAYTDFAHDPERGRETALLSLRKAPRFANAHFALGRALAKLGRFEEAREAFQHAIDDGAHNKQQFVVDDEVSVWKAQSEIGHAWGKQNDPARALEWFERALANRPGVYPVMVNRARALEALHRYADAEAAFRGIALAHRSDASRIDYVNYLLRREEFDRALVAIDELLLDGSADTVQKLAIAASQIVDRIGRGAESEMYLERARRVAPGSAEVLDAIEALYLARGETAKLANLHARELDAPCIAAADYARRANRLLAAQRLPEARAVAEECLAMEPDNDAARYVVGAIVVQNGDRLGALAMLETIRPTAGTVFARAQFLRSIILGELGRTAEALTAVETVLATNPEHIDAVMHRVGLLYGFGRMDDAEAALRGAMRAGGHRVAIELASLLMKRGKFDEARVVADEALAVS
jgi:tetratricopeptide (TPR) repeat protein